jgi:hypothetical protein
MDDSKFSSLPVFFIANYFFTFLIVGLLAGAISLINKPKPLRADVNAEALFSYYLLFTIGINNLVNFVFHVFVGDLAAEFIGWPTARFRLRWGSQVWAWESQESLRSGRACRFASRH